MSSGILAGNLDDRTPTSDEKHLYRSMSGYLLKSPSVWYTPDLISFLWYIVIIVLKIGPTEGDGVPDTTSVLVVIVLAADTRVVVDVAMNVSRHS